MKLCPNWLFEIICSFRPCYGEVCINKLISIAKSMDGTGTLANYLQSEASMRRGGLNDLRE
jgi:hypothetical protein